MKIFVIFMFVSLYSISGFPIDDDRIVFPDDAEIDGILERIGEIKHNKLLLDDPNILKSDNTTEEFLYDENADTKFENGKYFQGDIVLMEDQLELLNSPENDDLFGTRTGRISEYYRWPKNKQGNVIVPVEFEDDVYTHNDKIKIILAMADLEKYTCIEFVDRDDEEDYIYIHSGDGCHSYLGKQGGQQGVSLKRKGCLSRGTILHELIHVLGYDHMHNSSDRDKYVYILWDNIYGSEHSQFDKVNAKRFSNFGTSYDYYSVMHYEPFAFSKNGKATIIPKDFDYLDIIGQRNSLSAGDAKRINTMYNCY